MNIKKQDVTKLLFNKFVTSCFKLYYMSEKNINKKHIYTYDPVCSFWHNNVFSNYYFKKKNDVIIFKLFWLSFNRWFRLFCMHYFIFFIVR